MRDWHFESEEFGEFTTSGKDTAKAAMESLVTQMVAASRFFSEYADWVEKNGDEDEFEIVIEDLNLLLPAELEIDDWLEILSSQVRFIRTMIPDEGDDQVSAFVTVSLALSIKAEQFGGKDINMEESFQTIKRQTNGNSKVLGTTSITVTQLMSSFANIAGVELEVRKDFS